MTHRMKLGLCALLTLCACGSSPSEDTGEYSAALTGYFVQEASSDPQSSPTSVAVKMAKAQGAGDLEVVTVNWFNATTSVTSVTDTKGNTYLPGASLLKDTADGFSGATFYANVVAAAANANTVTVHFSGASKDPDLRIDEWSGSWTLDVTAGAYGSGTLASSGNATTTAAGDLLVGSNYCANSTTGPGAGFTSRVVTSPDSDILEDKVAGAPGAYAATAPMGGGAWMMQLTAFKTATVADAGAEGGSDGGQVDGGVDGAPDGALDSGADAALEAGVEGGSEGGAPPGDAALDAPADVVGSDTDGDAVDDAAVDGSPTADATVDGGGSGGALLIQHVSGSNLRGNSLSSPYCYTLQLPAPAQGGNAIVVGATWKGTTATLAVTDDQGDSYSVLSTLRDSIDNQSVGIAGAFGVTAGARVLSVCFSANPGGWVEPMATELAGVAGFDGAAGASGSGTTVSVSLSAGGDTPYQVVYTPGGAPSSFAGAQLLSADVLDGFAGQLGGSSMTLGTPQHWASVAALLRPGAVGSVPAGMRIVRELHQNIPSGSQAGGTGGFPNPLALQLPSSGNLLVSVIAGGCGCSATPTVTSIADNLGNTWLNPQTQHGGDAYSQLWYAANAATGSGLTASLVWGYNGSDETAIVWDVTGASTSPLDVSAGGSGSAVGGNLTLPFTLTTAAQGELIFVGTPWDFDTAGGLMGGAAAYLATMTTSGEPHDGPFPVDENNGWGHLVSGTSPTSITWVPMFGGEEFGNYSAVAAAFRGAP